MDGDEIHMIGQFRLLEPDVPRLGGRYRDLQGGPQTVEIGMELGRFHFVAQQGFVAGDHPFNHRVLTAGRDDGRHLALVVVAPLIEPDPGG